VLAALAALLPELQHLRVSGGRAQRGDLLAAATAAAAPPSRPPLRIACNGVAGVATTAAEAMQCRLLVQLQQQGGQQQEQQPPWVQVEVLEVATHSNMPLVTPLP